MEKHIKNLWITRTAIGVSLLAGSTLIWRVGRAVNALEKSTHSPEVHYQVQGRTALRHAKGFTVEYRNDCKIIKVAHPGEGETKPHIYILVPRGSKTPQIDGGAIVVETPVRRVVSLATVHAPLFLHLKMPEVLVGVAGSRFLNTPELVKQAQEGRLQDVGMGSLTMERQVDLEKIKILQPDLIITSGSVSAVTDYNGKLQEAGFKVAINSEWMEETPLGRAEWIKFAAAFVDREKEAEDWFSHIEQSYQNQCLKVKDVKTRPTVVMGMNSKGTWRMSSGRSYVAAYIQDAGGDYLWKGEASSKSIPLKMESVLSRAKDADIWLLHVVAAKSRNDMIQSDGRYALFKAFRTGKIFNNDAKLGHAGSNDYWETGVHRPDLVLADLIAILHPEICPDHGFNWYRQLPEEAAPSNGSGE